MFRSFTRTHTRILTGLVPLVAAGSAAVPAHAAEDTPNPAPSSAARAAGVEREGQAYMGWAQPEGTRAASGQTRASGVSGIDVSGWQGDVDWQSQWDAGHRFAYVKATEGTGFKSDSFTQQYNGSANIGMKRGSYHFARPDVSDGATQAEYFAANGGGWSGDGTTLPGVLDIEWNPYGATCYGKSATGMVTWIKDFTTRYKQLTGRDAVIYTATSWWKECTGNSAALGTTNPLWIARYASAVGELPAGWSYQTFWQYTDSPIDQDTFNGTQAQLQKLVDG